VSRPHRTVLITGSSGFLGIALHRALASNGALPISVTAGGRDLPPWVRCELLCQCLIDALRSSGADTIFHLAGSGVPSVGETSAQAHYWSNVGTTNAVAKAIEQANFHGRLVFCSSASVYGNSGFEQARETNILTPCSEYGLAKLRAEECLLRRLTHRCEVLIARVFHVFGPGQAKLVVYDLIRRLSAKEQPLLVKSTGNEARDFIFVDDTVRALIFLGIQVPSMRGPQIFNLCSGIPTRIRDLASYLLVLDGRREDELRCKPEHIPNPVDSCVGDPRLLANVGFKFPSLSTKHLADTISWVRNGDLR
jgi:nucleoside-diphosphate-sugar epimerase